MKKENINMTTLNSKKESKRSKLPLKLKKRMSVPNFLKKYEDYEGKVELDDGRPYMMGGASPLHEKLVVEIVSQFERYVKNSSRRVYGSNLYLKTGEHSIREPDLTVICDHSKFNGKVYEGIPRLIVEVTSSNKVIDLYQKKLEYYNLGVREYWVVLSKDEIQVNIWDDRGYYIEKIFESVDRILKVPVQLGDWDLVVEISSSNIPKEISEE
jgi:Uma2 family endonuclease